MSSQKYDPNHGLPIADTIESKSVKNKNAKEMESIIDLHSTQKKKK